jgi:hypothetical protein
MTGGDAGLRAIQQQVAPQAEHVLDWFHNAIRFTNLQQLAKGTNAAVDGEIRSHALAEIESAKWRLGNGLTEPGIVGLVYLEQWAQAPCFGHITSLKNLTHTLLETIRYLELIAQSMHDYGKLFRAGQWISTGFVESAVNEIVAKQMVKKQQMRWNQYIVQSFLDIRIQVLNCILKDAFRHRHKGFRLLADKTQMNLSA